MKSSTYIESYYMPVSITVNYLFHFNSKREAEYVVFTSYSLGDQHRVTKGTSHVGRGVPKSDAILSNASQTFVIIRTWQSSTCTHTQTHAVTAVRGFRGCLYPHYVGCAPIASGPVHPVPSVPFHFRSNLIPLQSVHLSFLSLILTHYYVDSWPIHGA